MPKKAVKLQWTDIQRQIASKVTEGANFEKLVNDGYTKSLVSKVMRAMKAGQKPPPLESKDENQEPRNEKREPTGSKVGTPTAPITVGRITITPENWGFTQYGAILVLDTYNKAKRDINYGGNIGDFLCDMCEFYRRILNYKEVEYARSNSERGGGIEENGSKSLEPALELTEGR